MLLESPEALAAPGPLQRGGGVDVERHRLLVTTGQAGPSTFFNDFNPSVTLTFLLKRDPG